jgi:hypothetical protein
MRHSTGCLLALIVFLLVQAGCRDASVAAYRVPKEQDAPPSERRSAAPAAMAAGADMANGSVTVAATAELVWTAPAHWKPNPGSSVRKGSYLIGSADAAVADMAITAFPGDVGGDLANVNRWRSQLAMPPITSAELPAALTHVDHNGLHMNVAELANDDPAAPRRMLSAIVPFEGATWFFKLTGPSELVAREKQAFFAFLESVRPGGPAAAANDPHAGLDLAAASGAVNDAPATGGGMADTAVTTASGPALKWNAPTHWEPKSGSAMRKGSYLVKGDGEETADLAITAFPGDVGGELANVNRWRGQLQLPLLEAGDLDGAVDRRQRNGLAITVVDLAGEGGAAGQRMVGAIVPFAGATWFFKLAGPDTLVTREKPAFLEFLDTLKTP